MSQLIESITGLVSSKIASYKALMQIMQLETKLAALGVYPLIFHLCMTFVFLLTIWSTGMIFLGYGLFVLAHSFAIALAVILFINLLGFFIIYRLTMNNLKKMSFQKTREYFAPRKEEALHENPKTKDLYPVDASGQNLKNARK